MKKIISGLLFSVMAFGVYTNVGAQTLVELQTKINALIQQIQALQAKQNQSTVNTIVNASGNFDQNLGFGLTNSDDVRKLQNYLRSQGYFSGESSGNFFTFTYEAVKKFQAAKGIEPTGFVGPKTRALINSSASVTTNVVAPTAESTEAPIILETKPSAPTASITANYTSGKLNVNSGDAVVLRWYYQNANGCSNDWGYDSGGKDSSYVYPTSNTTYTVTCYELPNYKGRTVTASTHVIVNTQPVGPEITYFWSKDPNPTTGATYIAWNTSDIVDSASLEFDCSSLTSAGFSLTTDKGNYPSCEKGGVWTWYGVNVGWIIVTPKGNSSPVTIPFTLSVLKSSGASSYIPTEKKETISITFPASAI